MRELRVMAGATAPKAEGEATDAASKDADKAKAGDKSN
jgi:hypothetical protein